MTIKYCLECAQPLAQKTLSHYTCSNGHDFWNNPQACVAVVLLRGKQILVSKRAREPFKGAYDLPGGFMEFGEDPFAAAIRETYEETGIELARQGLQLLTAYTGPYNDNESVCDLVIMAHEWAGEPTAADDSEALEWKELSFLAAPEFNPPYKDLRAIIEAAI